MARCARHESRNADTIYAFFCKVPRATGVAMVCLNTILSIFDTQYCKAVGSPSGHGRFGTYFQVFIQVNPEQRIFTFKRSESVSRGQVRSTRVRSGGHTLLLLVLHYTLRLRCVLIFLVGENTVFLSTWESCSVVYPYIICHCAISKIRCCFFQLLLEY